MTMKTTPLADTNITIIDRESNAPVAFDLTDRETGARIHVGENAGASTHYCRLLAIRVTNMVNSVPFKEAMAESTYMRFHRAGEAPTAITIPSLSSRSLTVNLKDPYSNNVMPTKATAYKGTTITSKPHDKSVMISMVHEKYDSECDGSITELTLQQEMQQVLRQLDQEITSKLVSAMEDEDKAGVKYFTNLKQPSITATSLTETYDDIEIGIYSAVRSMKQFGGQIEDFIIGVSPAVYAIMERMTRRSGHDTIECFIGTDVYQYSPNDGDKGQIEFFVFPRHLVAMSFREEGDGTIIAPIVTRKAETQSTIVEFVGTVDLICDGFTSVDVNGTTQSVKLPLVTKVTFDKQ